MINSERLNIRRFKISDLDDFNEYSKNPNVGPMAGWEPHKSKEESLRFLKTFIDSNEVWAIEYFPTKKVIGGIGLHKDNKRDNSLVKSIGYVLNEEFWNRGIISEAVNSMLEYAFNVLELDMVSAYAYEFNLKSRRVLEKAGFTFEGILRQATRSYDGKVYDDLCFSISKQEFKEKKNTI